jgi:hypothetical protein
MQSDESSSFLDRDTGRVETVSHDLLQEAEESGEDKKPDLPAWQKQEWETAKRIVAADRFQKLPTKFDVHEWAIMQDFSRSVRSDRMRDGIESAWFSFRAEALRQIAIKWCEENHILWE